MIKTKDSKVIPLMILTLGLTYTGSVAQAKKSTSSMEVVEYIQTENKADQGSPQKEKNIIRQKTYQVSKRKVNFDEEVIQGEKVGPAVSGLSVAKSDRDFDLVPIRQKWHQEMINSTKQMQ